MDRRETKANPDAGSREAKSVAVIQKKLSDVQKQQRQAVLSGQLNPLASTQPNKGSKTMVAQISTTIETRIIYTYEDFDGVMVDVVEMTYPNGKTETRSCWTEENFTTGETVHSVVTRGGSVLKSNWKTTQNNKWMTAYIDLWIKRYQAECEAFQLSMDTLAHPEFYSDDEYAKAKADLGFGW